MQLYQKDDLEVSLIEESDIEEVIKLFDSFDYIVTHDKEDKPASSSFKNIIIENLSGLAGVAKLNPIHAIILIIISMVLTIIGGAIPANMASKKDPVEALRSE